MTERVENQRRHYASHKLIGMNRSRTLTHFAAAGALATRQSGAPHIWPISFRFVTYE
jgi:hypothetical protein